ncbi:MAG: hypothetical protein WC809_04220 [Sinimarinibacterium sp.]
MGVFVALALCAGCANLPEYWRGGGGALDFWAAAVEADEGGRETMWQRARRDNEPWQLAMLQSLPDYSRYDAQAARRALKQTLATHPKGEIAALARVRLADLTDQQACETQAAELKHRLDEVIAIERKLDGNVR